MANFALETLEARLTPLQVSLAQKLAEGTCTFTEAAAATGYASRGAAVKVLGNSDFQRYLRALTIGTVERQIPKILAELLALFRNPKTPAAVRARIAIDLLDRAGITSAQIRDDVETERAPSLAGMGLPELTQLLRRLEAKGAGRIVDVAPAPETGGGEGGESDVFA